MWAQIEKGLTIAVQFKNTNWDQAGGRLTKFSARATVSPEALIMAEQQAEWAANRSIKG